MVCTGPARFQGLFHARQPPLECKDTHYCSGCLEVNCHGAKAAHFIVEERFNVALVSRRIFRAETYADGLYSCRSLVSIPHWQRC
jgi:hypothetical protein